VASAAPPAAKLAAPAAPPPAIRKVGSGKASDFLSSLAGGQPSAPAAAPLQPRASLARESSGQASDFLSSLSAPAPAAALPPPRPALGAASSTSRTAAAAFLNPGPPAPAAGAASAAAVLSIPAAPAPLTKRAQPPPPPASATQLLTDGSSRSAAPAAPPPTKPTRGGAALWELNYRTLSGSGLGAAETEVAASGRAPIAYCLALINVEGSGLPAPLARHLREEEAIGRRPQLTHRLLVSFFDCKTRAFFGSTWESPPEPIGDGSAHSAASAPIDHDCDVYFHSRLGGDRCVLVVEACYALLDPSGAVATEVSAGWTFLRPFGMALDDTADGVAETQYLATLFQGSPLALAHKVEGASSAGLEAKLLAAPAKLRYSLRSHRALLPAARLMAAHRGYSMHEALPGLLPGGRDSETGELELADFTEPRLQSTTSAQASAAHLTIPQELEARLRQAVHEEHAGGAPVGSGSGSAGQGGAMAARRQAAAATAAAAAVTFLGWRLLLGVHTGHAPGEEAQVLPLEIIPPTKVSLGFPAPAEGYSRLASAGGASVALGGLALTRQHGIVAELQAEYELAGSSLGAPKRVVVHAAWGVVVPYNGASLSTGRLSLTLSFGASGRPAPLSGDVAVGGGEILAALFREGKRIDLDLELRAPGWKGIANEVSAADAAELRRAADAADAALENRLPPLASEAETLFALAITEEISSGLDLLTDEERPVGADEWEHESKDEAVTTYEIGASQNMKTVRSISTQSLCIYRSRCVYIFVKGALCAKVIRLRVS